MDAKEFKAWSDYMKSRRGKWSIDPIHDGQNRDLVQPLPRVIAFLPDRNDHTKGVFVKASGSTIEAGKYETFLAFPARAESLPSCASTEVRSRERLGPTLDGEPKMSLMHHVETWNRYGSYLSGITAMACVLKNVEFDELYAAIQQYGHCGGWSKEEIRNAFNKAREWKAFAPKF